jgi:small-conductance mechanosensitive channel
MTKMFKSVCMNTTKFTLLACSLLVSLAACGKQDAVASSKPMASEPPQSQTIRETTLVQATTSAAKPSSEVKASASTTTLSALNGEELAKALEKASTEEIHAELLIHGKEYVKLFKEAAQIAAAGGDAGKSEVNEQAFTLNESRGELLNAEYKKRFR